MIYRSCRVIAMQNCLPVDEREGKQAGMAVNPKISRIPAQSQFLKLFHVRRDLAQRELAHFLALNGRGDILDQDTVHDISYIEATLETLDWLIPLKAPSSCFDQYSLANRTLIAAVHLRTRSACMPACSLLTTGWGLSFGSPTVWILHRPVFQCPGRARQQPEWRRELRPSRPDREPPQPARPGDVRLLQLSSTAAFAPQASPLLALQSEKGKLKITYFDFLALSLALIARPSLTAPLLAGTVLLGITAASFF